MKIFFNHFYHFKILYASSKDRVFIINTVYCVPRIENLFLIFFKISRFLNMRVLCNIWFKLIVTSIFNANRFRKKILPLRFFSFSFVSTDKKSKLSNEIHFIFAFYTKSIFSVIQIVGLLLQFWDITLTDTFLTIKQ